MEVNFNYDYNAAVVTTDISVNSNTYEILTRDSNGYKIYRILIIIGNYGISYEFHDARGHHIVTWQNLRAILGFDYETPMELINQYHQMFDVFDKMGDYGKFRCRLRKMLNPNPEPDVDQF